MIIISLVGENLSLDVILAFDRWIYLNKQVFPFIEGEVVTGSSLPKGFWKCKNIVRFEAQTGR